MPHEMFPWLVGLGLVAIFCLFFLASSTGMFVAFH
jgi:hypothetical protein